MGWNNKTVQRMERGDTVIELPTRGRYLMKEEFYSICSMHRESRSDCDLCQEGTWTNVWTRRVGHLVHDHCYRLWYWWVNRPDSKSRRNLERIFPGLKDDGPD